MHSFESNFVSTIKPQDKIVVSGKTRSDVEKLDLIFSDDENILFQVIAQETKCEVKTFSEDFKCYEAVAKSCGMKPGNEFKFLICSDEKFIKLILNGNLIGNFEYAANSLAKIKKFFIDENVENIFQFEHVSEQQKLSKSLNKNEFSYRTMKKLEPGLVFVIAALPKQKSGSCFIRVMEWEMERILLEFELNFAEEKIVLRSQKQSHG